MASMACNLRGAYLALQMCPLSSAFSCWFPTKTNLWKVIASHQGVVLDRLDTTTLSFSFFCSNVSFETLAAALMIGLFALFIVVYTICLQCCWSNRRCPWFLDKESTKDKYTFCPCVQGIQSPDSWQSATDLEQVLNIRAVFKLVVSWYIWIFLLFLIWLKSHHFQFSRSVGTG